MLKDHINRKILLDAYRSMNDQESNNIEKNTEKVYINFEDIVNKFNILFEF